MHFQRETRSIIDVWMEPEAQNILFVFLNLHFTPSPQIKVIKLINCNNLKDVLPLSMMYSTAFIKTNFN